MQRTQFTFYESFATALKRIRRKSDRCAAYDAIVDYAPYGTEPDLDALPNAAAIALELIRPNLDASRRKALSGQLGGLAKANGRQSESKNEYKYKYKNKYECEAERRRPDEEPVDVEGLRALARSLGVPEDRLH